MPQAGLLSALFYFLGSRRFFWILASLVGSILVFYFLFASFFFNPFEDSLEDTAAVVPRTDSDRLDRHQLRLVGLAVRGQLSQQGPPPLLSQSILFSTPLRPPDLDACGAFIRASRLGFDFVDVLEIVGVVVERRSTLVDNSNVCIAPRQWTVVRVIHKSLVQGERRVAA